MDIFTKHSLETINHAINKAEYEELNDIKHYLMSLTINVNLAIDKAKEIKEN